MRITRAAKVAAFPLTALILVALIACQGPAGPVGADGPQGPTGNTGATGNQGPMGYSALVVKSATPDPIQVNDTVDADDAQQIGGPVTLDVSDLFSGGSDMVTYSAALVTADSAGTAIDNSGNLAVAIEGSTLTVTLKDAATAYDPTAGYAVRVTAKDGVLETEVSQDVTVIRNRAPQVGNKALANLVIGTQAAKSLEGSGWPGTGVTCAMMNSCEIAIEVTADNAGHFQDYGTLTYEAESDDPSKVSVMTTDDGKKVVVTGLASTADGTNNRFADEGVTISITAIDSNGLTSEKRTVKITVKAQPKRTDTEIPAVVISENGKDAGRTLIMDDFVEGATSYTITDLDPPDARHPHVTADISGTGDLLLQATTNGTNGSRDVVVRAAEDSGAVATNQGSSVGQYLDVTISVTNSAN